MNLVNENIPYIDGMAGRPSTKTPSILGARLAELRKAAGLSQAQLAKTLGMPQRTLSYYEREADDLPAKMLTDLSRALGVSVTDILQSDDGTARKRGPKSKIERQLDVVRQLPRGEQQFVSKVLDSILQKTAAH
ncbi:MAG: helix-turn-helix domain-containing protein [Bryobacterales bacterium]|nr:helix-turn-helix domain-containing protein [Bryobacterales bacterium]